MDLLEKLLDNTYEDNIRLTINNLNIECRKYAILPIEEKIYFLLLPLEKLEFLDDGELIILYITKTNFNLQLVTEKDEFNLIYNHYNKLVTH